MTSPSRPWPHGEGTDLGDLLIREPHGQELRERAAVGADHSQRAVFGVDEQRGRLHDPPEHLGEIQLPPHRHHGLQEAVHPVAGAAYFVDAHLEFVQQFVQPHPRYPGQRIPHTHVLPLRRFARLPDPRPAYRHARARWASLRADARRD